MTSTPHHMSRMGSSEPRGYGAVGDARKRRESTPTLADWLGLLESTHRVCAEVRLDTPEDQALHDQHVQQQAAIVAEIRARYAGGVA